MIDVGMHVSALGILFAPFFSLLFFLTTKKEVWCSSIWQCLLKVQRPLPNSPASFGPFEASGLWEERDSSASPNPQLRGGGAEAILITVLWE